MATTIALRAPVRAFFCQGQPKQQRRMQLVTCATGNSQQEGVDRRGLLAGAAALTVTPLLAAAPAAKAETKYVERIIPVESLTSFQKADVLADFERRASDELRKVLTSADAPATLRLLINDAATFNINDPSFGGVNGSVVLADELSRPENKGLKPLVERLAKAKAAIDAQSAERGQKPISWADTIVLAAKVAAETSWKEARQSRATTEEGKKAALMFLNPIVVRLGRVDSTTPAPAGRVPAPGAPASEVRTFFNKLGVKPGSTEGPFAKRPPFSERVQFLLWTAAQDDPTAAEQALVEAEPAYQEWAKKYGVSRRTVTRTEYEVDFGERLAQLADLGATFDKKAYLYPVKFKVPAKF